MQKHEFTAEQQQRVDKFIERSKNKPIKFMIKDGGLKGSLEVHFDNSDDPLSPVKMMEALGTVDSDLQLHLLTQVLSCFVSNNGTYNEKAGQAGNAAMAILNGVQPQDEIEGMLAVQMVGVHNMAMDCISKATQTERVDFMNIYMNAATKSLRTFVTQMEAMKKYRTGGQQKMTIEHVHVNQGGQAIVGNVNQGGGVGAKNKDHE